uniref:hypothetical protein n=2 Tax=Streptococcus pneumoniae TaxID=1313 RepID=UPI001D008B28
APWLDSGYWIFRRKQPISYIILIILIILNWNRVVVRLLALKHPRLEDFSLFFSLTFLASFCQRLVFI